MVLHSNDDAPSSLAYNVLLSFNHHCHFESYILLLLFLYLHFAPILFLFFCCCGTHVIVEIYLTP